MAKSHSASLPAAIGHPRVLLVEDDHYVRKCCHLMLSQLGCQVEEAIHGQDAWQKLASRHHAYDLVITDDRLPFLSGLELARKAQAEALAIPFILMSGVLTREVEISARSCVIVGLLPKPITCDELAAAVEAALARKI